MKYMNWHLCFKLPVFLFLILGLSSCSDSDDKLTLKKEYLISQVSFVDPTLIDYNGDSNYWEYEYDDDNKLISVTQYNPRNKTSEMVYELIYDSEGFLSKIRPITDKDLIHSEYLVTHEAGKVTLHNMGADFKHYYYDSDRFITKEEDVFLDQNINFRNYSRNEKGQLTKVESGYDGVVDYTSLFREFDESEPFQFHQMFPTEDFIILYAFDLKYNGLGKPSNWDYGYYEYDVDEFGNVSEFKTFSDFNNVKEYEGGMRFKYREK